MRTIIVKIEVTDRVADLIEAEGSINFNFLETLLHKNDIGVEIE